MATATLPNSIRDEMRWFVSAARAPRRRTMRQFYEQELVIPEGKYEGRRWRAHRQPYAGVLLDTIDRGPWPRRAILGCVQSGKSFNGWVGPICYHVFECKESVIAGVPTMDISRDKWEQELLPVIRKTRYAALLPKTGAGSRGGHFESITFTNGATLKFMSGHGGDEKRSSFTARVVVITEVDKFDTAGEASRETDPISQLEDRTLSYEEHEKRIYLECTVSIEEGRIWREYTRGTRSRLVVPCPFCREWVSPERDHLVGVDAAVTAEQARDEGAWACPSCAGLWDDRQRRSLVQQLRLVHDGQEIDLEGRIHGRARPTDTLGFRWNAFFNLFWPTSMIAGQEWEAKHAAGDRENVEKERVQFWWALPAAPPDVQLTPLKVEDLAGRGAGFKKGIVPEEAVGIAVGVDTGKRELHWEAKSVTPAGRRNVIEYGRQLVRARELGTKAGLIEAMKTLKVYFDRGWMTPSGRICQPSQVWIDCGYFEHTDAVYDYCRWANDGCVPGTERYRPAKGYGENRKGMRRYAAPDQVGGKIRFLGPQYHMAYSRRAGQLVSHVNADHWKSEFHQGLAMPPEEAAAIVLFDAASPTDHAEYWEQLLAEEQREKFIPGKGVIRYWHRKSRKNHWLDAGYTATAGCDFILRLWAKSQETKPASWFAAQEKGAHR